MTTATIPTPLHRADARPRPVAPPATTRLTSADAFRGLVMLLMMAEVLQLSRVAAANRDSTVWLILGYLQSHVEWLGCSLHDLIQPSFSFLVGVALPFSIASRLARGQSRPRMFAHALWRSVVLVALGIFLRSVGKRLTLWEFTDTLCQIGLGYPVLFLLGFCRPRARWAALAVILAGYWLLFVVYPAAGPEFVSHWAKNANAASEFDLWFLNLFPRTSRFTGSSGGYATLSFIPTLGTMILGLIAGDWLRGDWSARRKVWTLMAAGVVSYGLGLALDRLGVCPSVKRIWTPSWVLVSGGWCFLILAGFYAVMDARGWRAWAFPLVVVGMNSIAMYCLAHLIEDFTIGTFATHLGAGAFGVFGSYAPFVRGAAVLTVYWLIALWMYRRRIFLRV